MECIVFQTSLKNPSCSLGLKVGFGLSAPSVTSLSVICSEPLVSSRGVQLHSNDCGALWPGVNPGQASAELSKCGTMLNSRGSRSLPEWRQPCWSEIGATYRCLPKQGMSHVAKWEAVFVTLRTLSSTRKILCKWVKKLNSKVCRKEKYISLFKYYFQ